MTIERHVEINIQAQTATVSKANFGTPLLVAHHTQPGPLVDTFTSIDGAIAKFGANHPIIKMAEKVKSQNPSPVRFKVARHANASSQVFTISNPPANTADAQVGLTVGFDIFAPNGTKYEIRHTYGAGETDVDAATAMQTQVDLIPDLTTTLAGNALQATATNLGDHFYVFGLQYVSFANDTIDLDYSATIAAARQEDDDFYSVHIEHRSYNNIVTTSSSMQAYRKIFVTSFQGTPAEYVTLADALLTASQGRTLTAYDDGRFMANYVGIGIASRMLTTTPGSETWKFKSINNVATSRLTETEVNAIEAVNGNVYTECNGVSIFSQGVMADGEFADVQRFVDWLDARMAEAIFSLKAREGKIAFTDKGIDQIVSEMRGVLALGVRNGGLREDPAFTIVAPSVADVPPNDRALRCLDAIEFGGELAGAIHKTRVVGRVVV